MGALQNEKFYSAPFSPVQWDAEGDHVEKTAKVLLFWYDKAGPGDHTGAICGPIFILFHPALSRVLSHSIGNQKDRSCFKAPASSKNGLFLRSYSSISFKIISSICLGVTTKGFSGKCLILPVTR